MTGTQENINQIKILKLGQITNMYVYPSLEVYVYRLKILWPCFLWVRVLLWTINTVTQNSYIKLYHNPDEKIIKSQYFISLNSLEIKRFSLSIQSVLFKYIIVRNAQFYFDIYFLKSEINNSLIMSIYTLNSFYSSLSVSLFTVLQKRVA